MLILPGILTSYQSLKDRTLKIVFETQEPTPEHLAMIATHAQNFGYVAFKKDTFKNDEKEALDGLKSDYDDTSKSQSQRLRNVFYVAWKQKSEGYKAFPDYYNAKMEKVLDHFKSKLD